MKWKWSVFVTEREPEFHDLFSDVISPFFHCEQLFYLRFVSKWFSKTYSTFWFLRYNKDGLNRVYFGQVKMELIFPGNKIHVFSWFGKKDI